MIAQQLLESGILQLGLFVEAGKRVPYRLRLEMLAAYPHLFNAMVDMIIQTLPTTPFDRLVAYANSVALAGAITQKTGIPLVYSRGRGEAPVYDLVGAYDVGHPACLLVNVVDDKVPEFLAACGKVGLNIHTIVTLVGLEGMIGRIQIVPVLSLATLLSDLYAEGNIPQAQMQAMVDYLQAEK